MKFTLSLETSKKKDAVKSDTGFVDGKKNVADSFYTYIANSIFTNNINSSRDLLLYFFNNVSEVNSLITYIAQKGADIPVKHVKLLANGKEKDQKQTDLIKKLNKPNHLNNGREFKINCFSSYFVHGFIPLNVIKPIGWDTLEEMYLLPGNNFYPIPERSTNQYGMPASGTDFRTNKIKQYRLFIDNRPFNFDPEEILLINDSNLSFDNGSYLTGQSRLYSAIRSIKTLSYIYDTINTLIAGKGAEGILFKRSRAGEIDGGWDPDNKKLIEDKLMSYGLTDGKRPIATSDKDLGFLRLSVPVGDFMPIELKEHEFRSLATAIGVPSMLFNDTKATTYNNLKEAEKAMYTNAIMPLVNAFYEAISVKVGLSEIGEALKPDYSGIECLQADKKLEAETNNVWNSVFEKLWTNNMVTRNQWLEYLNLPRVNKPEYDKYKNELEPEVPEENNNQNTNGEQTQN